MTRLKNIFIKIRVKFLLFYLTLPTFLFPQFSHEEILNFAHHLYATGDYAEAIGEYERLLFFFPHSPVAFEVRYRIGKCYQKIGKTGQAVRQFKELLNSPYREKALLEIPLSYYLAQDYPKALAEIEKLRSPSFSLISKARSLYLKGRCLLKLRKYSEAKAAFANLLKLPENNFTSLAQELKNKAEAALNLPRKKPLLALFLSAIIPGSGKFYLGRKYDGAFSFLLTTSSALITYYYYHQRKTFQTFLAGSLTIFFYTGNIYGSWIGARLFNKKLDQRYLEELERTYPVSIFE